MLFVGDRRVSFGRGFIAVGTIVMLIGVLSRMFGCMAGYGVDTDIYEAARSNKQPWMAQHMTWSAWQVPVEGIRPIISRSNEAPASWRIERGCSVTRG